MSNLNLIQCHAETLIANTLLEYSPENLVLSYNGGKDCTVLLDLVGKVWKRFPQFCGKKLKAVYVSEAEPFPELEYFIDSALKKHPFIQLNKYVCGLKDAFSQFSRENGLINYAILLGVRNTDPFCENLQEVHASDNGWPNFIRISPILRWSYSEIWAYIDHHNVDYCDLYKKGYTSLGSKVNTRPNPALEDGEGIFLHARALKSSSLERLGRNYVDKLKLHLN